MGAKFKIGDRVRALRSCGAGGFVAGGVYIVKHAYFQGAHHRISVEVDSVGSTTNGWIAENFELLPVAANAQPTPLTIQAGAYYRTRDGRKVGPAEAIGGGKFCWDVPHGQAFYGYTADGKSCIRVALDDLIAEWVDEPAADAKVAGSNDNGTAGFTIPIMDDEDVEPDSKLVVSISADTTALDAEIDRVLRRLKKLKKKARKLGVNLEYSELLSAA